MPLPAVAHAAATLSSGTMSTLTGCQDYRDLDAIQGEFVQWCLDHPIFDTWQDAWHVYHAQAMGWRA